MKRISRFLAATYLAVVTLVAAGFLVFGVVSAHATPISGPVEYQHWANASWMPTPAGPIQVIEVGGTACGGEGSACAYADRGIIEISTAFNVGLQERREAFMHELGHFFEYAMPEWMRQRFLQLRRDRRPWRALGGNSPHEQFAEAYALCALRGDWLGRQSFFGYGYRVSQRLHERTCRLIRRAGEGF